MDEGLHALECSIYALLIPDLIFLLQNAMPDRSFYPASSNFYDQVTGDASATQSAFDGNSQQCSDQCFLDMHEFVLQEAAIGLKKSIASIALMVDGTVPLRDMRNLGFAPVYNTLSKLQRHQSEINYVSNNKDGMNYRIEAGGGSGVGFQLFCDGREVLTAGGGGGGKEEFSPPDFSIYFLCLMITTLYFEFMRI